MIELGGCARCLGANEGDAACTRNLLLEVVSEGGEDRIRQLGHDDADGGGVGGALTGWTVVAQLVDRCENPAARVFGNLADTVENT